MSFAASTSINANEILLKCNDVQYKEYEEPRKQFEIVINIDKEKAYVSTPTYTNKIQSGVETQKHRLTDFPSKLVLNHRAGSLETTYTIDRSTLNFNETGQFHTSFGDPLPWPSRSGECAVVEKKSDKRI